MLGNIRLGNLLAKRFISKNEKTGRQHKNGTEDSQGKVVSVLN
jgi:hypothetical protein